MIRELCSTCVDTRDHGYFRWPLHVVHPIDRKPMLWDVYGEAICRYCGALWRARLDNTAELIG